MMYFRLFQLQCKDLFKIEEGTSTTPKVAF